MMAVYTMVVAAKAEKHSWTVALWEGRAHRLPKGLDTRREGKTAIKNKEPKTEVTTIFI